MISWCTIADVKITFSDDMDGDIEAIRELLADADKKVSENRQHLEQVL